MWRCVGDAKWHSDYRVVALRWLSLLLLLFLWDTQIQMSDLGYVYMCQLT